ncbi:MAG TPA: hypothetical protein VMW56_22835 [Candidatus Margulisiibacteriota bacterium]|nr:hypothetical protein [Candidatus Margulisiibacteriota bacterium]
MRALRRAILGIALVLALPAGAAPILINGTLAPNGVFPIVDGPIQQGSYSNATRPSASTFPAGTTIWNTDAGAIQVTDGVSTWASLTTGGAGVYLPLAGGTMSGAITFSGTQLGTYTLAGTPNYSLSQSLSLANTTVSYMNLESTTAAANNSQQYAPAISILGRGWQTTGPASEVAGYYLEARPVQGTTHPSADLVFISDINNVANEVASIKSVGAFVLGGNSTIGPNTSQQHVVPAVASDTFALLAATQELTNKTVTSPVMKNGLTASGSSPYDFSASSGALTGPTGTHTFPTSTIITGAGDGTGSVTAALIRQPAVTGTNAAPASMILQAGAGTGNAASAFVRLETPIDGGSTGTTAQTLGTVLRVTHVSGTPTTILGRGEASASPVATVIRGVQPAGTNIAGVNWTWQAPMGTGTGHSGDTIWQIGPAGSTGTTLNTPTTVLTLGGATGNLTLAPTAAASGSPTLLTVTGPAHTGLTASTEAIDYNFNGNRTVTWAAGTLTTQRFALFQAPTVAFASSSTCTTCANVVSTGAPVQGTNATLTNAYSFWSQSGVNAFQRDSVGTSLTTVGALLINTTASANNSQQYSPAIALSGRGWGTGDLPSVNYIVSRAVQGASRASQDLVIMSYNGSSTFEEFAFQSTVSNANTILTQGGVTTTITKTQQASANTVNTNIIVKGGKGGNTSTSSGAGGGGQVVLTGGDGGDGSATGITGQGGAVAITGGVDGVNGGAGGSAGGPVNINGGTGTGGIGAVNIQTSVAGVTSIGKSGGSVTATGDLITLAGTKGGVTISMSTATTAGSIIPLKIACANNSQSGSGLEVPDLYVNSNRNVNFLLNTTVTRQESVLLEAPTYVGTGTPNAVITTPSTLDITGAPVQGSHMTFTNGPYAIRVESGNSIFNGGLWGQVLATTKQTPAFSGGMNIDPSLGGVIELTLTANMGSWTISNGTREGQMIVLTLVQSSAGSYTIGTPPSKIKWLPTSYRGTDHLTPTLTSGSSTARDSFFLVWDGTNWLEIEENLNN